MVDPARIEQVLGNLIANGVKYSPGGGEVAVRLRRDDGWIEVTVRDEGIGIPLAAQAKIFAPFVRTTEARSAAGGAGLGLYIARQIIAEHGGTIAVASAPGRGSTFTVRLPLGAPPGGQEPATGPAAHDLGRGTHA